MVTKVCYHCGISKKIGQFAKNQFSEDGYDGICKKCRKETIQNEEDLVKYSELNTRPFHKDLLEKSMDKHSESLKIKYKSDSDKYYKEVFKKAMTDYYRGMNFSDRSFSPDEFRVDKSINDNAKIDNSHPVAKDVISFWGKGFSNSDYNFLEDYYNDIIISYEHDSPIQRNIYKNMAITQLEANKARSENRINDYDKLMKSLSNLMNDANIKPVQETGANAAEQATLGLLIKKWENERPIPDPEDEFKDVDGIMKYVQVWFLGHLSRMLNIENSYSKIYEDELEKYTVDNPTHEERG